MFKMVNLKSLPIPKLPCWQKTPPCNFECTQEKQKGKRENTGETTEVLHFDGPVRVVIVDPPQATELNRTAAGLLSFANMMIAANTIIVVLFTLSFYLDEHMNLHVLLSTVGLEFCLPLSILMLNPLYGPAAPMDKSTRVCEHVKLIFMATLFVGGGIYFCYFHPVNSYTAPKTLMGILGRKLPFNTYHWYAGLGALGSYAVSSLSGLFVYIFQKMSSGPCTLCVYLHRFFGMLTMLVGNLCYILGIITPTMQILMFFHAYLTPTIAIGVFTTLYTIIMLIFPGWYYTE